jgi:hypothetical protein
VFTQDEEETNNENSTERKIGEIRIKGGIKGGRAYTKIPHLNGEIFAPTTPITSLMISTAPRSMMGPGAVPVSPDFDEKWGWVGGLFLKCEVTDRLAIELDVLYSQKGAKSSDPEIIVNIDYIEVPVLLNVRVKGGLSLCLGPYVALRVTPDDDVLDIVGRIAELEELSWELKKGDWGISFGGSFQTGKFIIEPRCSLGMMRIFNDVTDETDAKNFAVNLMLGYEF